MALPDALIGEAESALSAKVRAVTPVHGGYTGQATVRLALEDGRTVIMKTAAPGIIQSLGNVTWPDLLRRECWMYANLPTEGLRPDFYGELAAEGWVGLLIEDLAAANRVPPWTPEAIDATSRTIAAIHAIPLPADLPKDLLRRVERPRYFTMIRDRGRAIGHLPYSGPVWWNWFDVAAARAEDALDGLFGDVPRVLCHNDVRSDNQLHRNGRALFIDWGQTIPSSPATDSVYWSLGVEVETGKPAEQIHQHYTAIAPDPGPAAIAGVLAFWTGYFVNILQDAQSMTANQRLRIAFLSPTLRWLAQAIDLPPVPEPNA